jgi:two-component system, OmpR family, response regulator
MRILIVEDEHKIANSIKKGLEQENYAVDVAYDGEEGFDLASSESYQVIILDLMLPKMDGMEICSKLRESGNHSPILILTAKSDLEDKVRGLNLGADDYLTKPFAFIELLARIKALTRRNGSKIETVLKVRDLTLNTLTYAVKRGGSQIDLSKTEYSILEFLMRNKGQIFTKDQIISHVWEYDADILPNTIEVFMGYLRNKIDRRFKEKKPLIHTLRGFGYKIE